MARVLTVDDDPIVRRLIEGILEKDGHEVDTASTGAEALRFSDQRRYDAVLVDYHLPDLNGLEILRVFREVQPSCLRMLVTGALDLPMAVDAVNRGEVARVVEKPLGADQLREALDDCLSNRERMVEVFRRHIEELKDEEKQAFDKLLVTDLLFLVVQPIIDARSGRRVACEALLRSRHPMLPDPQSVLRVGEQLGRIDELANIVVARAFEWLCKLPGHLVLFVNLHPDELGDPSSLVQRMEPLAPFASRVVLEITERSRLRNLEAVDSSIGRLRALGFRLAVDDLGSGYSSLSALAELRPEFIKVDMGIVRGIDQAPRKQRLVELVTRFAEATDSVLISEGVETEAEAEALRACGSHWLQGYLYGYPSPEWDSDA